MMSQMTRRTKTLVAGSGLAFSTAFVFAGGVVLAAEVMAEPKSQTETEIKDGCKEAGGSYATTTTGGKNGVKMVRFSQCTFTDMSGDTYTDSYKDGKFLGQQPGTCGSARCGPA